MANDDFLQPEDELLTDEETERLAEDAGLDEEALADENEPEHPRGGELGLTPPD